MISFSPNRLARRPAVLQRGLSLIELMISIAIGLIILAALTTTFVNQSRSRAELEKTGRLVENGSYALDVLAEDLRLAGFYGELDPPGDATIVVPTPTATTPPNPCSIAAADMAAALLLHVQGYNNATSASKPACITETIVPGTDILVVRRASTTAVAVGTLGGGTLAPYLQASLCPFDTVKYVLNTAASAFTLRTRVCTTSGGTISSVRRFFVHIYFIAANNVGSDGIPTLKRLDIDTTNTTITPLAEGVENMQIDYGLDDTTPFNGTVDAWADCSGTSCTNQQWANVASVRVHLLMRSLETSSGYTDAKTYNLGLNGSVGPLGGAYKRRVYSQFIRLTNPAGRREGAT